MAVLRADVLAAPGDAAAAGVAHRHAADGALVAGDGQHLDLVGLLRMAAHGHLDALADDGALLVDAAAGRGLRAGDDGLRNGEQVFLQPVLPGQAGDFLQDLVFQFLYTGIEFRQTVHPFSACFRLGSCAPHAAHMP